MRVFLGACLELGDEEDEEDKDDELLVLVFMGCGSSLGKMMLSVLVAADDLLLEGERLELRLDVDVEYE